MTATENATTGQEAPFVHCDTNWDDLFELGGLENGGGHMRAKFCPDCGTPRPKPEPAK